MDNATNITNSTTGRINFFSEYRLLLKWTIGMETIYMIVGTFLNLWLLLSILTSRDLRERMRNQLIVNLCAVHLVQTLIKCPLQILKSVNMNHRLILTRDFFCHAYGVATNIDYAQSFLADWLMVFIICIFIANIMDVDLASKWTPKTSRFGKVALHVLPWIVAVVVTPIAIKQSSRYYSCSIIPYKKLFIFETVYTIIPTGITLLLMVFAIALRCRRFSSGFSTSGANMGIELVGKGPEIDNTFAYILAAAICIACEICHLIFVFEIKQWKYRGIRYQMTSYLIADSRVIFMVFPWLLLPDIRQRIRSWRPWQREVTGIDLTVAYGKEYS